MSEPITPKAERHVVEGEFIDTPKPETHTDSSAKSKTNTNTNSNTNTQTQFDSEPLPSAKVVKSSQSVDWIKGLLFVMVLLALVLAGYASWQTFKPIDNSGLLNIEQRVQTQQQAIEQLVQQNQRLTAQLEQLKTELQTLAEMNQAAQDVMVISSDLLPAEVEQKLGLWRQQVQHELVLLQNKLADLSNADLPNLAPAMPDLTELQQSLQTQTQQQMLSLQAKIAELQQSQADLMQQLTPKVEQAVTEIKPAFEGFMSRFNDLFVIKKHETSNAPIAPATEPQP